MHVSGTRMICVAGIVAIVSAGVFGCGGGAGGLFSSSPGKVATEIYMAANDGEYSEVEQRLSTAALDAYEGPLGAMAGGTKGIWDRETRNGTLAKVDVITEDVRGEGANVSLRLTFGDGSSIEVDRPLVKEGGTWKVSTWTGR